MGGSSEMIAGDGFWVATAGRCGLELLFGESWTVESLTAESTIFELTTFRLSITVLTPCTCAASSTVLARCWLLTT
jgi:hypothetical protein